MGFTVDCIKIEEKEKAREKERKKAVNEYFQMGMPLIVCTLHYALTTVVQNIKSTFSSIFVLE